MKEKTGKVFNIAMDNPVVLGCTVSKQVLNEEPISIYYFSMANDTDISAESYAIHKLLTVNDGAMTVYTHNGTEWTLQKGESILTPLNTPIGVKTKSGAIYTEYGLGKDTKMNQILKAGEVLSLKDLIPYQDGKIVNMDLAHNEKMKFVLMSFSAETGLSEHAAPGDALIMALDGEGIIGYEGIEHRLKAGESFRFAKNGRHTVKAVSNFKMALLITLE